MRFGHLLYARFWNQYLYHKGMVSCKEPFSKLRHQGMILGSNGEKMSKSKGNVVNPDDIVKNYGADSLRLYEMFMGPIDAAKPWDPNGIEGSKKFIDRVWRLYTETDMIQEKENASLDRVYHYTVKKVTHDYEHMEFNTAISQMMIFINMCYKANIVPKTYALGFLQLLNPVAPHITEELWQLLGNPNSIAYSCWPTFDENKIKEDTFNLPIQVNGKLRGNADVAVNLPEEEIKEIAHKTVSSYLEGKEIVKEIYVTNKIYNIVIK